MWYMTVSYEMEIGNILKDDFSIARSSLCFEDKILVISPLYVYEVQQAKILMVILMCEHVC